MPRGATEAMDYKIGDKVVYPNHGVGLVEQISYGVLNGRTERYFASSYCFQRVARDGAAVERGIGWVARRNSF